MKTISTNYYTIDEHPNPDAVFQYVRENWHDLAQDHVYEVVNSLKAFADFHGVTVDYCVSAFPDRGEYVRLSGPVDFSNRPKEGCTLTGVCYDDDIRAANSTSDLEYIVLNTIHSESEYTYSDEGLRDFLYANNYYFDESGKPE